ncbi:type 1 glutamine amidotransferase [Saliterribacillus persicus]|uniref:GMP synthase-like glutamine amidotransferase n=1 Tax=Saliterribacillus persicus TaxID=930114 RepID=A0A368X8K1_9BACI|nr:type 1 glutamine amidotransferase [Saliterribacillus persicus]RCW62747.1 GMP synthase-like glutamine amidotransferase [Saliterribacillus persicus]
MKIHIIQHVPFEKPGLILEWINERRHTYEVVKIFDQESFPSSDEVEYLVVLGGPMSANDSDEWIATERQLIKEVVEQQKPMFGICLGAQQLAKVFGGSIVPAPQEVGWENVQSVSTGKNMSVLHWHGEGFTLPEKSILLYSSSRWENQGFRIHNAIGLQFHFETTETTLSEIVGADAEFLGQSVFKTSVEETLDYSIPSENKEVLFSMLDTLEEAYKTEK